MTAPAVAVELPAATEILPADAPHEEWLEARRQGIGGSDAPVLLGVNHYSSPYRLWLDKTGRADDEPPTEAMLRGTYLEPWVRERFAADTGMEVARVGLAQHNDVPCLQATLDGATDDGGIVEIKTVGDAHGRVAAAWFADYDRSAMAQLQYQMLVTGRSPGYLACYVIDRPPIYRGPFEPDLELHARILDGFPAWWAAHVLADVPPPADLDRVDSDEVRQRWPHLDADKRVTAEWPALVRQLLAERAELSAVESAARAAERRRKEIDAALLVMLEDGSALVDEDGRTLITAKDQRAAPRVDPALADDLPDVWQRYVTSPSFRRLYVPKEYR